MGDNDVTTTLEYQERKHDRPFLYARLKTDEDRHKEIRVAHMKSVELTIKDGRGLGLSLDENSFELFDHVTSMKTSDFYNSKTVENIYYDEMKEFLKKVTGASHIQIIHHQIRNAVKCDTNDPTVAVSDVQNYAQDVHVDTSRYTAEYIFKLFTQDPEHHKGRFVYLNVWRNISDNSQILNDPLAVLDQTSLVAPDDYIECELYVTYDALQYRLSAANAHQHRWYYFPEMRKNEALVFKQYDSDTTRKGRMCFHSSFSNPNADQNSPIRESIEVRALCYFPEHKPNTCPQVEASTLKENPVDGGVGRIMKAVSEISGWPHAALIWIKFELAQGRRGVKNIATILANDENGYLWLKYASRETKEEIVKKLMENSKFEDVLRSSFEKIRHKISSSLIGANYVSEKGGKSEAVFIGTGNVLEVEDALAAQVVAEIYLEYNAGYFPATGEVIRKKDHVRMDVIGNGIMVGEVLELIFVSHHATHSKFIRFRRYEEVERALDQNFQLCNHNAIAVRNEILIVPSASFKSKVILYPRDNFWLFLDTNRGQVFGEISVPLLPSVNDLVMVDLDEDQYLGVVEDTIYNDKQCMLKLYVNVDHGVFSNSGISRRFHLG